MATAVFSLALVAGKDGLAAEEKEVIPEVVSRKEAAAPTVAEARVRARILHDAIHGTLQLVHRDYFSPHDKDLIPSATLEEMFEELEETWGIAIRWLGVEGKTMNIDHKAKDSFEKEAVKNLAAGKPEFEVVEELVYRRAAPVVLHNACLKCHVPDRTSLENRVAGLVISIPLVKK